MTKQYGILLKGSDDVQTFWRISPAKGVQDVRLLQFNTVRQYWEKRENGKASDPDHRRPEKL